MVIEVRQSYSQYNSPSCAHAMIPTFVCVLQSTFRTFSGQFQRGLDASKTAPQLGHKAVNDKSVEISVENTICGVE